MAGDRARVSHDPGRKWRGLVAQQGRVTVEADWNEAEAIRADRDRRLTLDVTGRFGTPDGGYAVTAVPAAGGPGGSVPGDLVVGPGTLYVGGERLDLDVPVQWSAQPDWLDSSTDPVWQTQAPPTAGTELVYLLASEQEVSAVEDPALADVALGGPDTMQRQRVLQRFVRQASPASPPGAGSTCGGAWSEFESFLGSAGLQFNPARMTVTSASTLQVSFTNPTVPPSPCQPATAGGYLGAENQMIRVMVTGADASGVPHIVWGFDDASFLYRITSAISDSGSTTLTLASAPADSYQIPVVGQYVEVLRDAAQLTATNPVQLVGTDYIASATGVVTQVTSPYDPTSRQLVLSGPLPGDYVSAATPQLFLRVWQTALPAPPGQPVPLVAASQAGTADDTGVAVTLTSGTGIFHPGDFWRFALRPLQPAIVYPARYLTGPQPPDGPRTWACPLAVLDWQAGSATVLHCVPRFADLVELTARGGGCTVDVGLADVDGGASLPTLLSRYARRGPVTICLEPGRYTLPEPLVLGPEFDGLTLRGCRTGVVLQAPAGAAGGFASGLITVQGANSVTISGIELAPPPVAVRPGSFGTLSDPNQVLLTSFSANLQVAFGVQVSGAAGLTVEDCTFSLPDPGGTSFFAAGIYAAGTMTGVTVANCTFRSAVPLTAAPFHDLATGSLPPPQPPWPLTFGCLHVPVPTAVSAGPALLDEATIERCLFQDVTVPVLLMAGLGSLSVLRNTARETYGGFWVVSVDPGHADFFDQTAIGDPNAYHNATTAGTAPLLDRILAIAPAMGKALAPAPSSPQPPAAGTSPPLRLAVRDCQVDAVLAGSYSGAGLLVADLAEAAGSAIVHGNRIRNRFLNGDTALVHLLEEATVTGNILANEIAAAELSLPGTDNFSLVWPPAAATPLGVPALAVTGNVLVGPTLLPARPGTLPQPLQDWDVLNTVISFVLPPIVTGISTTSGPLAGGGSMIITGHGFTGVTGVKFGSVSVPSAAITFNSDTQITVTIPAGAASTVDVTVTTPAGTSATSPADVFTYTGTAPTVTGLSPAVGTSAGGTSVTIAGSGFLGVTGVKFGTASVPSAAIAVNSDAEIVTTSPPGTGTVNVTVSNAIGTSAGEAFTYVSPPTVTGISVTRGTALGGTIVTITGHGFIGNASAQSSDVRVQFGTASALAMTVVNDTQITATSPPGTGTVHVTVSNLAGTSATSAADEFGYVPVVTAISPASGPITGGTVVTISGAGFTGATSVQFGPAGAAMTVNSDSQITATSPPAAAGTVRADITVTTPTGTSAVSPDDQFTYLPVVTGVSPGSGFTSGGDFVTISGVGFSGATSVRFGAFAAVMTVDSDTQISATSPFSPIVGTVDVTVTTPAGTSLHGALDHFAYVRKNVAKEGTGKEGIGKEKEHIGKEVIVERQPFLPNPLHPEVAGGIAEAFIEPAERPDVGGHLLDDPGTGP